MANLVCTPTHVTILDMFMLHIAPPSRDADRYAQQLYKNDLLLYQWYINVLTIEVIHNKENKIIIDAYPHEASPRDPWYFFSLPKRIQNCTKKSRN